MQINKILYQSVLWRGLFYLSAFIVNLLIARHFEASISGSVYYSCSVFALVLLFLSLSIESGITFFSAKNEIPTGKLLNFSFLWSVLAGILTFCFVLLLTPISMPGMSPKLLWVASISFICGNLLTSYCTGLFYAKNDFVWPNVISIGINVLLILLLPFKGNSLLPGITNDNYFYIYFISFLVQGLVIAAGVRIKYIPFVFQGFLTFADIRLLFRYCITAYVANLIFFLLYRIDYLFVKHYCTPEQLGNYIQVSKLGQLFFILPTILASAVFPLTAGGQKDKINSLLTVIARSLLLLYVFACLILALLGNWLFPFAFGKSFSGMYYPFLLLIPGILSLSGLFTLTAYYAGKNKMMVNIRGSLLALVVIVAGDSIFIPCYGINAAALVSSIGYMVYQAYVLYIFKREYKVKLSEFFISRISDWKVIMKIVNRSA